MSPAPSLVWFRDDLRLADNPTLHAAAKAPLIAVYVLDEQSPGIRPMGAASKWWLHHSLESLRRELRKHGISLVLARGAAERVIPEIARAEGIGSVHFNRRYGDAAGIDDAVVQALEQIGVAATSHQANLLFEPGAVRNKSGEPYKVFTAFWRAAMAGEPPRAPLPVPGRLVGAKPQHEGDGLRGWHLLPTKPDWSTGIAKRWRVGEAAARKRLAAFIDDGLAGYDADRDLPARDSTSHLSPHLRFGEISPFQVFHAVSFARPHLGAGAERFLSEIGWREFNWQLLAQQPKLAEKSLLPAWDDFPWAQRHPAGITAWQHGRTGIPIVDAGMRELWQTGFMQNRVRMITASFLVKHLLQDWRIGESWFWDTLVDADPANNPGNWQWVAGSGADASPFFRIFNPVTQGKKFDAAGTYVRRFVTELRDVPDRLIHEPWKADRPPADYPRPIVTLEEGREKALQTYRRFARKPG